MSETFSLFIKDFTHLDGAFYDPLRGPIGISYRLGIEFIGSQIADGTVFDFSAAKKLAKKIVDKTADHAFSVPHSLVKFNTDTVEFNDTYFYYNAPRESVYTLDNASIDNLISKLEIEILVACRQTKECGNLLAVKIHAAEEKTDDENRYFYNYTHGLKENNGNCQRLVHGHRSSIRIYVNNQRRDDIEKSICQVFADKHFAWIDNVSSDGKNNITVKYTSSQGVFSLVLPKSKVITMNDETTVENISKFIAQNVAKQIGVENKIEVHAFEGIEKGSKYIWNENIGTVKQFLLG